MAGDPVDPRAARRHLLVACLTVNAAVFALSRPAMMAKNLHDAIGVVFLAAAMVGVRRDDDDTERYGIRLEGVFPGRLGDPRSLVRTLWESLPSALREVSIAAGVALLVLPIYSAAWPLFNRAVGPRHAPSDLRDVATELVAVAFTEEMFFRGYVHTRVADALGVSPRATAFRDAARVVLITSALFAITHVVVAPTVARAVVFFPALLFGALRIWRGGIGAAVALHAAFNLWERYLEGR
jgi:hypothetical protein